MKKGRISKSIAFIGVILFISVSFAFTAGYKRIDYDTVKHPESLMELLNAMYTQVAANSTAANELVTDHATYKTVVDDLKTLSNALRSALVGDSLLSDPGLADGTNHTGPATAEVYFLVNGAMYEKDAVTAGTALSGDNLPVDKYGAWAVDIGANGTIDIGQATGNGTGYDTEAAAIAAIPDLEADHVRLGYMTLLADSGGFIPGTSLLNSTGVDDTYYDGDPVFISISAVSSSSPATLSASSVTTQCQKGK